MSLPTDGLLVCVFTKSETSIWSNATQPSWRNIINAGLGRKKGENENHARVSPNAYIPLTPRSIPIAPRSSPSACTPPPPAIQSLHTPPAPPPSSALHPQAPPIAQPLTLASRRRGRWGPASRVLRPIPAAKIRGCLVRRRARASVARRVVLRRRRLPACVRLCGRGGRGRPPGGRVPGALLRSHPHPPHGSCRRQGRAHVREDDYDCYIMLQVHSFNVFLMIPFACFTLLMFSCSTWV
jgi:hypothetical protein